MEAFNHLAFRKLSILKHLSHINSFSFLSIKLTNINFVCSGQNMTVFFSKDYSYQII